MIVRIVAIGMLTALIGCQANQTSQVSQPDGTYTVTAYSNNNYTAKDSAGHIKHFTLNDVDGFIGVDHEVGTVVQIAGNVVTVR